MNQYTINVNSSSNIVYGVLDIKNNIITDMVNSVETFIDKIEEDNIIIIYGMLDDLNSNKYNDGRYIVITNNHIQIVVKKTNTHGLLWTSTSTNIEIIKSYQLIRCNPDIFNKSIKEESETDNDIRTLAIREFNLDKMVKNPNILIIGKRGSGKSVIVSNILNRYNDTVLNNSLIISPTEPLNPFYTDKFPQCKIEYEYTTDSIKSVLNDTKECVVVLDDCCLSISQLDNDKYLYELLLNGRHYNKTVILIMQYPLDIAPELRCNFDYIFLLNEAYISNQKKLYNQYACMFPNFQSFRNVFQQLTINHGSMAIVSRRSSRTFLEKIYHYKSELIKDKVDDEELITMFDKMKIE
jgi:hypothetical protein